MRAVLGANGTNHHSSEEFVGKDGDPLQLPIVCVEVERPASSASRLEASETMEAEAARGHDVGDVGAAIVAKEASTASSPAVSSTVSPISALPVVSCEERCIVLPFVQCSTRYVVLPLLPLLLGLLMVFA